MKENKESVVSNEDFTNYEMIYIELLPLTQ